MHWIMKPKDLIAGGFFLLVGTVALFASFNYSFGEALNMGPGYFPRVLSVILIAFGAIMMLGALRGQREQLERISLQPLLFVLAGVTFFGILIRPAGLVASIFVLVFFGALASREITMRAGVALAVSLAAGSVLVFVYLLGQPISAIGYWFQ